MCDPIKWFEYQGSCSPLAALYKNSPPDPGAGYSWDRGHSQFSCCLRRPRPLLRLLGHTGWHTAHTRPRLEGLHTVRYKWGIKVPVGDVHLRACVHTPNWQHFVMVLLHSDKSIKEVFLSHFMRPLPAAACQTNVLAEMCLFFNLALSDRVLYFVLISPCGALLTVVKHWPVLTVMGTPRALRHCCYAPEESSDSQCVHDSFDALAKKKCFKQSFSPCDLLLQVSVICWGALRS